MSSMVKAQFKLSGLRCSACALSIDFDLEDLRGIRQVATSYARQVCEVEFDASLIGADEIVKHIRQSGYEAHLIA